jgi:PAS domain S-box-containing protein
VEVDAAGNIHYLNPAAQRLFPDLVSLGAQHPWLAGLTWLSEQVKLSRNQPFTRDVEINGVWYKQSSFSVPGSSHIRIYGLENTEAKLAERQLWLANQQLQDIIEFLPDATLVIDKKKKVIAWNKAIEEMTGLSKKEIIGKAEYAYAVPFYGKPRPMLIDLIGRTDREMERKYSFIKRKKNILFAEVFVPQVYNGKGAFVWAKASPLYDSDGHMVGAIETIRDITEQKQAEAILKNDKAAFEQMVNDKTEQLLGMQKELAVAKHLSEIGALAATIAHELRNPLAAIRTAAYNINRKSRDVRLQSHLVNIEKKVLESDQIINNLLSYSRIKTPHYQAVAIHELLRECVSAARERFPKAKVNVQLKCTCKPADTIKADPLQVREMFNNVLNNAYEALPEKKGKIGITAEYKPRGHFTVTFRDNGSGISPDDLKKISQPFFTTKSKGTGLGLTVCHQLVSLHNGTVRIESEQGKGTAVIISLPVETKTV